jgi:hypothetical protein
MPQPAVASQTHPVAAVCAGYSQTIQERLACLYMRLTLLDFRIFGYEHGSIPLLHSGAIEPDNEPQHETLVEPA